MQHYLQQRFLSSRPEESLAMSEDAVLRTFFLVAMSSSAMVWKAVVTFVDVWYLEEVGRRNQA